MWCKILAEVVEAEDVDVETDSTNAGLKPLCPHHVTTLLK